MVAEPTPIRASRNLYQRIQAVAQLVGEIPPTGKNQYKTPALSIEDVENALRAHLAEHGIITRWTTKHLQPVVDTKGAWMIDLGVTVVNADDPSDQFDDDASDIGNSPAAAASFARKGYYKALFHIAGDDDADAPATQPAQQVRQEAQQDAGNPNRTLPIASVKTQVEFTAILRRYVEMTGKNPDSKDDRAAAMRLAFDQQSRTFQIRPKTDLTKWAGSDYGAMYRWFEEHLPQLTEPAAPVADEELTF